MKADLKERLEEEFTEEELEAHVFGICSNCHMIFEDILPCVNGENYKCCARSEVYSYDQLEEEF